jgi:hypothetical protein
MAALTARRVANELLILACGDDIIKLKRLLVRLAA